MIFSVFFGRKLTGPTDVIVRGISIAWVLVMAGCAATPIQYTHVTPPSFAPFAKPSLGRPAVALVLGGGGSRGFAHVGVINALEANGIKPDIIVGTSAGSYVGALYAGGFNPGALERIALQISEQDLRDIVFPNRGIVKGELVQDTVNKFLYNRNIEELPTPFAAIATDLQTGDPIAFDRGNTGMAVRASSSIPGVFQPVQINGHDYVDGGLVSPVPVRVARAMGGQIVIAVDVSKKTGRHSPAQDHYGNPVSKHRHHGAKCERHRDQGCRHYHPARCQRNRRAGLRPEGQSH